MQRYNPIRMASVLEWLSYLICLPLAWALLDDPHHPHRSPRGDLRNGLLVPGHLARVRHDLQARERGPVVDLDEAEGLLRPDSAHPALNGHLLANVGRVERADHVLHLEARRVAAGQYTSDGVRV